MLVPLLLHLLMLQNWSAAYLFTFNAPLWSIAVECQIYLIFPLILLLWRRAGLLATLVVTFLLAHGVLKAMHHHGTANYLFIFFLGMWGASLTLKGDRMPPWEWLALAAAVILPFVCWNDTAGDLCIGVMISILMASCAVRLRNPVRELLSFGPLCWIGTFSYSIYLIHSVVQLVFLNNLSIMSSLTSTTRFVLFVTACTPLILILSYLFYLVLERPFLSKRARNPALADVVPETSAEPGLVTAG
jgi:peptidoglycan/LPS O-acetylase OafA/YrhL